MIDLDIYAREKPVIDPEFQTSLKLNPIRREGTGLLYRWFGNPITNPRLRQWTPWIDVLANQKASLYGVWVGVRELEHDFRELRSKGVLVPESLREKIKRDEGALVADKEMHRILEDNPGFEVHLAEFEPTWSLARATRGEPTYGIHLEANFFSPKEVVREMTFMSLVLATRFKGIIYDGQTGKLGTPNLEELYKMTGSGGRGVLELLGRFLDLESPQ